jgi:pimeloyl-ACP methyl ester carboxylesterase
MASNRRGDSGCEGPVSCAKNPGSVTSPVGNTALLYRDPSVDSTDLALAATPCPAYDTRVPRLSLGATGEFLEYTLNAPPTCETPDLVVIYVHGFASSQRGEKATYFGERFVARGDAFLTFDLRGHGESSGTMMELTVTRALADVETVLAWAGERFARIVVIGSSLGGQLAAWAAARRPKDVTANLLIAPAFSFYENRVRDLGPGGEAQLRAEGYAIVRNEWVTTTIGRELVEDAAGYGLDGLLPTYRTPTLILHGTDDTTVPLAGSVDFARRSDARPLELVVIAGGDHRLTDHKELLFDHMIGFLRRLESV